MLETTNSSRKIAVSSYFASKSLNNDHDYSFFSYITAIGSTGQDTTNTATSVLLPGGHG